MSIPRHEYEVKIQYINPSNGNRPASVVDTNGNYYTITDAALELFEEGEIYMLSCYRNNVVVEVNGHPILKDAPVGGTHNLSLTPQEKQQLFKDLKAPYPSPDLERSKKQHN